MTWQSSLACEMDALIGDLKRVYKRSKTLLQKATQLQLELAAIGAV